MYWQYTSYVPPLLIAAAVSFALALIAWRRRPAPGATPFALLMLAVAEWSLGYVLELGSVELPTKVFWTNVQYLGVVVVPVAWVAFALQYTGQETRLTRRNLALLAVEPLLTLLLIWTNDLHGLFRSDVRLDASGPFSVLTTTFEVWFWVNAAYSYLLLLLGTLLLLKALIRSPHLYRGQTGALLIGALTPWVGNALYISGLSPFPHLDLTPFAFTMTGLAVAWGLFRFRLLDIVPVARDAVVEAMSDGVLVLDTQNRILDLNPAAERAVSRPAPEVIGLPLAQVLSAWPGLIERYGSTLLTAGRDVTEAHTEIVLPVLADRSGGEDETQRHFDLNISPLHDRHGHLTGRLVVWRDITARVRAETERARLLVELDRRAERLAALQEVTAALNRAVTAAEVFAIIRQHVMALLPDSLPPIFVLVQEGGQTLAPYIVDPASPLIAGLREATGFDLASLRLPFDQVTPETRATLLAGQPFVADDLVTALSPGIPANTLRWPQEALGMQGLVAMPFIVEGNLLGVMIILTPSRLSEEDLELLTTFAHQAANAINKSRLLEETQERGHKLALLFEAERAAREQAETLREVAGALSTSLDREQVLQLILEQMARVVDYDSISVMLVSEHTLDIVAWRGFRSESQQFTPLRVDALRHVQEALEGRRPVIIPDTAADPRWRRLPDSEYIRCWLGVPLVVKDRAIGLLNLDKEQPGSYTERDAETAVAFADQAALAVENARLFGEAQRLAITDPLTGLHNRRHFFELAEREFERARRYGHLLSAIMLDLDGFKQVNDTYGHAAGDQALARVAALCKQELRTVDLLGRYGGEEFMALLPDSDLAAARRVAERLCQHIPKTPIVTDQGPVTITLSLGVAALDEQCADLDALLQRADQALYAAKQAGRNCVRVR